MDSRDYYTAGEIATITGITTSKFKRWVEKGLFPPARRGPWPGYDERHIKRVREIQEILDRNMTMEDLRDYFNPMRKMFYDEEDE